MNERREEIRQLIQDKGEVRFAELEAKYPSLSGMTLRRDLDALEREGSVVRIRGGAKSLSHLSMIKELAYSQRQSKNIDGKIAIAQKAVSFIEEGSSVYIDSGTTCMCLAQRIADRNLFALTPAPAVAMELIKQPGIKVSLTGGQLNRETLTLSGFNASEYVKGINIDYAFIAASAFSLSSGFSCGDFYEAELKRLIIKKAQKVFLLMDHTKLRSSLPYTFAKLGNIDVWLTDSELPEDIRKAANQAHVTVLADGDFSGNNLVI